MSDERTAEALERLAAEQEKTAERLWQVLSKATEAAGASQAQNQATAAALTSIETTIRPMVQAHEAYLAAQTTKEQRKAALLRPAIVVPLAVLALAGLLTWGGYLTWTQVSFDVPGVLQGVEKSEDGDGLD